MADEVELLRKEEAPRELRKEGARTRTGASTVGEARRRLADAEHAVFLVPGLLGFERFATFGYFADRVGAALRANLEQVLDQPVPVVPVPIPPTAALRERQRRLVRTLADRLHGLEHGHHRLTVHLVGHSTGGVDAQLLTRSEPIGGGKWSDLDPRAPALRERIRSVVTIASPHQGACVTRDAVGRLMSDRDLRGIPVLARLLAKFALSSVGDLEVEDLAFGLYREVGKTRRFLADVLTRWPLLEDLQPSRVSAGPGYDREVVRRSFVTVAGRPVPGGAASTPDIFFRDLSARASGWDTGCAEEGELVRASVDRLHRAVATQPELVIAAAGVEPPEPIDAGHNDGVVNTARQLIDPGSPDELAGVLVGDHFDVVGYYDRELWQAARDGGERPKVVLSGLLHSGSGFRDREFFELYRRVAQVIAGAARRQ